MTTPRRHDAALAWRGDVVVFEVVVRCYPTLFLERLNQHQQQHRQDKAGAGHRHRDMVGPSSLCTSRVLSAADEERATQLAERADELAAELADFAVENDTGNGEGDSDDAMRTGKHGQRIVRFAGTVDDSVDGHGGASGRKKESPHASMLTTSTRDSRQFIRVRLAAPGRRRTHGRQGGDRETTAMLTVWTPDEDEEAVMTRDLREGVHIRLTNVLSSAGHYSRDDNIQLQAREVSRWPSTAPVLSEYRHQTNKQRSNLVSDWN